MTIEKQDDALEQELGRLKPRALSGTARGRIVAQLGRPAPAHRSRVWPWAGWGAAAAVAAAVLVLLSARWRPAPHSEQAAQTVQAPARRQHDRAPVAGPTRSTAKPLVVDSTLVARKDRGLAVLPGYGPVRKVNYRFVDTYCWHDPARNVTVTRTTPREEVVLVRLVTY